MIIDVTETMLIPGNHGKDCPGNGDNPDIECCCDECDYMMCCLETYHMERCADCHDKYCPHVLPKNKSKK